MLLSDKQIEDFQEIYLRTFGQKISKEEAYEQGAKLIQLIQIAYKPLNNGPLIDKQ